MVTIMAASTSSSQACLLFGLILALGSVALDAFVPPPAARLQAKPPQSNPQQDTAGSHLGVTEKDTSADQIDGALDQERFLEELKLEAAQLDEHLNAQSSVTSSASQQSSSYWKFRGYDVFRQVAPPREEPRTGGPNAPAVILVHGFGCSTVYWRETIRSLTDQGYEVHALDLLGQGRSAKPTPEQWWPWHPVEYSLDLWAEQVDAYARENLAPGRPIVLIGNSVGSLICLTAATGDFANGRRREDGAAFVEDRCYLPYIRQHVVGIGEFNCGIGMNIRNILKDPKWNPVQRWLLTGAFNVLETMVFDNTALLAFVMDRMVTRDMLRKVLRDLYSCAADPEAKIDAELVDSFYLPAKESASPLVLRQILTNDAGLTPMELHAKHGEFLDSLPIHVVWGDEDKVIPIKWQVPRFLQELSEREGNAVTMDVVHGGHILFDECPGDSNGSMLAWLNSLQVSSTSKSSRV